MMRKRGDGDAGVESLKPASRHLFRWVIGVIAALLLVTVAAFILLRPSTQEKAGTQAAEVITYSTDTPSEEKPGSGYKWRGTGTDPMKLTISSIGIDAYIQNVGVDQNQQIAVPNNVHIAGWFVDSVKPGNKGLSIIDGHLDGRNGEGVFDNLDRVASGATFTIEFGDGEKREFRVKEVKVVGLEEAADALYSQDVTIAKQLNLITCGGVYDTAKKLYDKRVIVISELVEA